jgi:molybdopterin-guanine dinucleotide biosynthesis protein B
MIAVNLVGYKKSGKTTLALELAEVFNRRGVRVAAIKYTHHDRFDLANTDTARLKEAYGASVGLAGEETAIFWNGKRFALDLLPLLDADLVVVEGGKTLGWLPRVLLPRDPAEAVELGRDLALASYGPISVEGLPSLQDAEALADLILSKAFALPGLDCGACGREDCRTLAAEIVSGAATPRDCKAANAPLSVKINGQVLGVNDFVQRVIGGAIRGMLRECKGYAPGEIEIKLSA